MNNMNRLSTRDLTYQEWRIQIWPRILTSLNKMGESDSRFRLLIPYLKDYFFTGQEAVIKEKDKLKFKTLVKINSSGFIEIPKPFKLLSADVLELSDVEELYRNPEKSNEHLNNEVFMWGFSRSGYDEIRDEIDKRVQYFKIAHVQYLMTLPLKYKAKQVVENYINNVYRNIYFHNESVQFLDDDYFDDEYRAVLFKYFKKCLDYIVEEKNEYTKPFLRQISLLKIFLEKNIYHYLASPRLIKQVTDCFSALAEKSKWLTNIGFTGEEFLKNRRIFGLRPQSVKENELAQPGFNLDGDWVFDAVF